MKQEEKDKSLRDKMNALDPLSGGIVFGREEAWDKLQQRIEQKPAKKIAIKYWLAAAAVLLLMICITAVYNTPSRQIAKVGDGNATKKNTTVKTTATPSQVNEISRQVALPVVTSNRHMVHVPEKPQLAKASMQDKTNQLPATQIEEAPDDNRVADIPAPVISAPQPMKVIHINDLDRNGTLPQVPAIASAEDPTIDVSKLPVVHINDVIRQDIEIRTIRRENRMSFGQLLFRPSYADFEHAAQPGTEEYNPSTNPFKTIFNKQN